MKEKAVWIKKVKALLKVDLHFGKASHFKKSSIPIPDPIHDQYFTILKRLIETYQVNHVYFLGDLSHSNWNSQREIVMEFLSILSETRFHLIKGNHDILPSSDSCKLYLEF